MADRVNTQSPTTLSILLTAGRITQSEYDRIQTEGRREAVREIRKRLANEVGIENFRPPSGLDVIRILDEVAALNASESPPTQYGGIQPDQQFGSTYYGSPGSIYDEWRRSVWIRWTDPNDPRRCPAASSFEEGQCLLWNGHPGIHELANGRGDASESVQPPESHDDE